MNTPKSDMDYLKQSIEIDAIAFAYQQMKELFALKLRFQMKLKMRFYLGYLHSKRAKDCFHII